MKCEITFDTERLQGTSPGSGRRLVEIVDDEMRRVAVVGENESVALEKPGIYGAILKLDGERSVAKTFDVGDGTSRLTVSFRDRLRDEPRPSAHRVSRGLLAAIGLALIVAIVGIVILKRPMLNGSAKTSVDRVTPPSQPAPLPPLGPLAVDAFGGPNSDARTPPLGGRVFRDARRDVSGRAALPDASIASAPPEPTETAIASGPASEAPSERSEGPSSFWLAIVGLGGTAFLTLAGLLAAFLKGPAGTLGTSSTILLERSGWSRRSSTETSPHPGGSPRAKVRVAIVHVRGFDPSIHSAPAKTRHVGDRFPYRRTVGEVGLPRVEVSLPGAVEGIAMMIPALESEEVVIGIQRRPGEAPQPQVTFGDADVRQMLLYRESFRMEESAELAAGILRSLVAGSRIERPASVATALYLTLRTGRLPLDELVSSAERLAADHPWLPDAHVIVGEIAARQARHGDAIRTLLKVAPLGPPFTSAGVTYLSDRLSLYDQHLEKGLKLDGLRKELNELLAHTRDLTMRMMAGEVVTTFRVGEMHTTPPITR